MSDYFDYSDTACLWLSVIYSIEATLFLFNFIFAMFNAVKYVWPLEERSKLVTAFYVLVLLLCLC